jgi:hypothetical protein
MLPASSGRGLAAEHRTQPDAISETVSLTVRPKQTIALLLGCRDASQYSLKIQRYPIPQVDADRLQGLSDQ